VVTLFLLTVLGLLLGVSIKNRMLKAGLDSGTAWSASRRWWEVGIYFLFNLMLLSHDDHRNGCHAGPKIMLYANVLPAPLITRVREIIDRYRIRFPCSF